MQVNKLCTRCGRERPVWKRFRNQPYCKVCAGIKDRETKKEKRKKKREVITDKKLHQAFAKLVKQIYPLVCHACSASLELGSKYTHACHFVQRGRKIVTWDIRNVYPGCATCNGFVQSHVYELGKKANMYWGEGTAESLREMEIQIYKWSQGQKRELYELFTHPPEGKDMNETRQLILEQYLKIRG